MPEYQVGIIDRRDLSIDQMVKLVKLANKDESTRIDVIEIKEADIDRIMALKSVEGRLLLHPQCNQHGMYLHPVAPDYITKLDLPWLKQVIAGINKASTEILPWISIHLGLSRSKFYLKNSVSFPCKNADYYTLPQMLKNLSSNSLKLSRKLGIEILVENME